MHPTRFPPVFDDSPIAYAFALFSLALITSISLAVVIGYALEHRHELQISRLIDNHAPQPRPTGLTLLRVHRMIVSGFLLTIIFGALPDVLVMLAWGEASDPVMYGLFQLDRLFDGLTIFPFLLAVSIAVRANAAVDHVLGLDPIKISLRPTWALVRDRLKIVGVVLCIALGVTVFKAGWA